MCLLIDILFHFEYFCNNKLVEMTVIWRLSKKYNIVSLYMTVKMH